MSSGKHFDEIDENALGEVSGAGDDEQWKKLHEKAVPAYGAPLGLGLGPMMNIFKNPPLDKDSKDKDKKENAGEPGEYKN